MKALIKKMSHILPDKIYLPIKYKTRLGKFPNLKKPKTFNEKLQWLKIYDRKPEYTIMVDKHGVKEYIAKRIGEQYVIPTIGLWDRFEDIDFEKLPEQFVLKCTHDSGGLIICKDKSKLDKETAKEKINRSLATNYYWHAREWPYKNVKPRILAEPFMKDGDNDFLPVYKFMCFNGEPRIIQTIQNDKQPNESIDYFDTEWNLLELRQNFPNSDIPLKKPEKLSEMCNLACKLAIGHAFLRVDFYTINGEIKFSEHTFYSDAGFSSFTPESWDMTLGQWIELPKKA